MGKTSLLAISILIAWATRGDEESMVPITGVAGKLVGPLLAIANNGMKIPIHATIVGMMISVDYGITDTFAITLGTAHYSLPARLKVKVGTLGKDGADVDTSDRAKERNMGKMSTNGNMATIFKSPVGMKNSDGIALGTVTGLPISNMKILLGMTVVEVANGTHGPRDGHKIPHADNGGNV